MTDQDVSQRYEIRWNGGALLPGYPTASSLLHQGRERQALGRIQHARGPEVKRAVVRLAKRGISLPAIAKLLHLPKATVYGMVRGYARV